MVFDWFRRQYQKNPPAPEAQPEAQPEADRPAAPPETPAEPAPNPSIAPTPDGEDYLAWAKAAYQNLKRQEEGAAPSPETPAPEAPPSADPTPEAPPAPESTALAEPPSTSPEPAPSPDDSSPTPPQPVSFLQRAEADRQERLERLKAESIAADPAPAGAADLAPPSPDQPDSQDWVPDENFLWSAEVLAAQGRQPEQVSEEEIDWLQQLRQGLGKTRQNIVNQLKSIVGQGPLGANAVTDIEALLLQADVGVQATDTIIEALQDKLRQEALPPDQALLYLKGLLRDILDRPLAQQAHPILAPEHGKLNIWLLTGVNGAGKTTTLGKLAHLGQKSGYRCLIAAADTFRAAAVQQVQTWGDRTGIEVIANPSKNTDPAAVVYDAIQAAKSRETELLLVDTAGRLQNKKNLMEELSKIRRIIDKNAQGAIVESLLVLDSTLGQNGIRQAEVFSQVAQLSGVVLTKLDGSARGGVALSVSQQLNLPIRFIGVGEGLEDLRPFSSYEFVEALLSD